LKRKSSWGLEAGGITSFRSSSLQVATGGDAARAKLAHEKKIAEKAVREYTATVEGQHRDDAAMLTFGTGLSVNKVNGIRLLKNFESRETAEERARTTGNLKPTYNKRRPERTWLASATVTEGFAAAVGIAEAELRGQSRAKPLKRRVADLDQRKMQYYAACTVRAAAEQLEISAETMATLLEAGASPAQGVFKINYSKLGETLIVTKARGSLLADDRGQVVQQLLDEASAGWLFAPVRSQACRTQRRRERWFTSKNGSRRRPPHEASAQEARANLMQRVESGEIAMGEEFPPRVQEVRVGGDGTEEVRYVGSSGRLLPMHPRLEHWLGEMVRGLRVRWSPNFLGMDESELAEWLDRLREPAQGCEYHAREIHAEASSRAFGAWCVASSGAPQPGGVHRGWS
jgi:hypothetical protein